MKTCSDCKLSKTKDSFYTLERMRDGLSGKCKECTKKDVKANSERVGSAYDFSEKGFFRVLYKSQKRHQKLRGHGDMPYSKADLETWCRSNGFQRLYDEWKLSGNDKNKKPSVDRIDSLEGYSFDNIRLVTWSENRLAHADDIKKGRGAGGLRCKALMKLDSNKHLVCEYVSYSSAQRDMGYSIEYPIKKGIKCRNGFYWVYK